MEDTTAAETLREEAAALLGPGAARGGKSSLLVALAGLFAALSGREDFHRAFPEFTPLFTGLRTALDRRDAEGVEDALTMIYACLHGKDSAYSPGERAILDASGGYWCHAGGLSPLWRAAPYIGAGTRLADYGAGNGLQGLLFQYLYPHRETTQIELSGPMIEKGKVLQDMLGIDRGRVRWIHGSVADVSPRDFDVIYIYRPLRPEGAEGRRFYENFAGELAEVRRPLTIFSIADCLKDFLDERFRIFYDDGQLTCFSNGCPPLPGAR